MRRAVYAQRLPLEHSGGPGLARRAVLRMGGRAWQGGFEVEMSEPYSIFTGLPLPELESLRADITSYVQARHAKPIRFGNAVGPVQPKAHSSTRRESLRREYVGMAECRRMHSGRTGGSPAGPAALLWVRRV